MDAEVRYIVDVNKSGDGWRAKVFCNGQWLTVGYGKSPIEAAADGMDNAATLNAELESLII